MTYGGGGVARRIGSQVRNHTADVLRRVEPASVQA